LSRARGRAIELAAAPVALLPGLASRDVDRVLFVLGEPMKVPRVALLRVLVLALDLAVELLECSEEVATARLARDEEVLEVREQPPIVRRDHEATGPLLQPAPQPIDGGLVEILRGLVEQQDVGAGRLGLEQRELALLAVAESVRVRVRLRNEARLAPRPHATTLRVFGAGEDRQQRGFAHAVTADERDVLAREAQGELLEQRSTSRCLDRGGCDFDEWSHDFASSRRLRIRAITESGPWIRSVSPSLPATLSITRHFP
jgi:hypothetical protein